MRRQQDHRPRTGRGQVLDLAIVEPLMAILGPQVSRYDQLGTEQPRLWAEYEERLQAAGASRDEELPSLKPAQGCGSGGCGH